MNKHLISTGFILSYLSLAGCSSMTETTYTPYQGFDYAAIHDFPQSDNMPNGRFDSPIREVVVPETYHVGAFHSPVSHKNRDKSWVDAQNPGAYTIQITEDEKASFVANKLMQTPKNERQAEIKALRDGKTYYRGLYGSYKTKEEAQKAYENLPQGIKSGASIKHWGTVQEER